MSLQRIRPADIRLRDWGWRHAGRHAWAARDLSLDIEPGERVLLLGASGAGKSTLLHALAGVLGGADEGDEAGTMTVDGRHPGEIRGRVGLVLQDPDSQVILARVGDDVAFGGENLGVPRHELWRRVDWAMDAVGLTLDKQHLTSHLSGGQKQRLALAGVLAMQPGLLLLDEPTANLDPDGVIEVRNAVGRVVDRTDATLIVVEHRVSVWKDLVNRVIVLDPAGGVLADGPPDTVLTEHADRLTEAGVWVPNRVPTPPARRRRPGPQAGPVLLTADAVAVGRRPGEPVAQSLAVTFIAGTATAVTGANGVGKSTLALTLGGLIPPLAGTIRASPTLAAGAGTAPIRWRSRELLTRIGTVFQEPEHQFLKSTVRDELMVGPGVLRTPARQASARIDELMHRLRLTHLAEANPFTLSGGEKRRLSVATMLATAPAILILDEPTFGQDARTWRELVTLLAELVDEGVSLIAVTHDAALVSALADTEYRMTA